MKAPEEEGPAESHGAEERLRQHLLARLPADEVEEALRRLRSDPVEVPAEDPPLNDSSNADPAGANDEDATAQTEKEAD